MGYRHSEKSCSGDHMPVDVENDIFAKRWRKLSQQLRFEVKSRVLLVPELVMLSNRPQDVLRQVLLLAVMTKHDDLVHRRIASTIRCHLSNRAHDVAEDCGTKNHHTNSKSSLQIVHRKDVAIADSCHGCEDPVEGRYVLLFVNVHTASTQRKPRSCLLSTLAADQSRLTILVGNFEGAQGVPNAGDHVCEEANIQAQDN
mmetsp:Transcript_37430/g.67642  ORF Transcript_37430/g.67642 Transcript_37430/m.67642 type:complete len:200 (+) Transcript_37430:1022-1621(+)